MIAFFAMCSATIYAIVLYVFVYRMWRLNDTYCDVVSGRDFYDCAVTIDNKVFVDCVFHNVTFKWKGGLAYFEEGNKITGNSYVLPGDDLTLSTLQTLRRLPVRLPAQIVRATNVVPFRKR